jgi:hypothetical protein
MGVAGKSEQVGFLRVALTSYPEAKRALIAQGRPAAEVEAMPVLQVLMIDAVTHYRRLRDDIWKWGGVPWPQARAGLEKAERELIALPRKRASAGLLTPFLPAIARVYESSVRLERRIAALRTVEAIRLYAAAHDGKLPAKLADITEVPVPDDPATGKSFDYRVDGDRVTLRDAPVADGRPALSSPLFYELTFKR